MAGVDPWLDADHPYLYPPLLAVALVPSVLVPALAAAWLWMAASAAALTLAVSRVAPDIRTLCLAILFAPFAANQWNLQANAFVLLAIVVAREALDEGKDARAGVALGLAIALKPLAFFAALWLLASGRWKAAAACASVVVASFLLVFPFLGATGVSLAVRHVALILRVGWSVPYPGNISLNGSLDRLLPTAALDVRHRLVAALVLGVTAVALFVAARRRSSGPPSASIDFILAGTLLAADASWLHQSTILFPALALSPGPIAAASATLLYSIAAGWRAAGPAAAFAALAGTFGIAVVWAGAGRRATSGGSGT